MPRYIPLLCHQDPFYWVKRHNLFEEVEIAVPNFRMWEERDGRGTGPGDNRHQQNPHDYSPFDSIHHENSRQNPAAEDADPHGWTAHLVATWAHPRGCVAH